MVVMCYLPGPFTTAFIFPSKATSATDGCRDARELISDGLSCPLARLMGQWLTGGHAERSFARHAGQTVHVEIPPHKYQVVFKNNTVDLHLPKTLGISCGWVKH